MAAPRQANQDEGMTRMAFARCGIALLAGASMSVAVYAAAPAGKQLRIETRDDRELNGVMDVRTDERHLWLRREERNVVMTVPVAWDAVATASVGGDSIDVDDLKSRRNELASAATQSFSGEPELASVIPAPAAVTPVSFVTASQAPHVRNLEIVCAELINLDRDVEPDGIEVSIAAVGEHGLPLAVRGSFRATLVGERRPATSGEIEFGELGRWTQRVRPEDFVDGVATYDLRFRVTAPEWEFDVAPDAILTIELGASGHGHYAASAPLALRRFNPLRDQMQLYRDSRFAPAELHGPPPLGHFGPQHGRWQFWAR
jgi:hypothetical protein